MAHRAVSHRILIPLGLLVVAAVSFGALVNRLGFFWDDWTIIWTLHFMGPEGFQKAFSGDRPLLAWVYQLTTPLIGESPWAGNSLQSWHAGSAGWRFGGR